VSSGTDSLVPTGELREHRGLHLHHELRPPAVVAVRQLLQTPDHLPEGGDEVAAPARLQERTHRLEVQHRGVERREVAAERRQETESRS